MKSSLFSDFYSTIIDVFNSGVCVIDTHKQVHFVNETFRELTGFSNEHNHIASLIDSFDKQTAQSIQRLIETSGDSFESIRVLMPKTNTWSIWKIKNFIQKDEIVGQLILVEPFEEINHFPENQEAYLSLFEDSPIPIWDEDFSWIKHRIDELKAEGITDIREYIDYHPEELDTFIRSIVVNAINQAVVEINEAESKSQVLENYEELVTEKSAEYVLLQIEAIFEGKTSCEFDAELLTFKRNKRFVHFKWSVVKGYENTYGRVYLTTTDLTERLKEDNLSLQQSNREKEMLLKEVHHRVKNNLQIISSLLRLQANGIQEKSIKDILQVSLARIGSMAAVHELLYKSSAYSKINYFDYLETLVDSLLSTFVDEQKIDVEIVVDELAITIETAIPLGLLINEILTNSLKHGFIGIINGNIYVHFSVNESSGYQLFIGDNGNGIDPDLITNPKETLGISLIESLAEQLSGTINRVEKSSGTHYELRF